MKRLLIVMVFLAATAAMAFSGVEPPSKTQNDPARNLQFVPGQYANSVLEKSKAAMVPVFAQAEPYMGPLDAAGGPDGYGYIYKDETEVGGPTYNWIDTVGATSTGITGDDSYGSITLPFTFTFYGNSVTTVYPSTNGQMGLSSGTSVYSNAALPTTGLPVRHLCPYWDDLYVEGGGINIMYKTVGSSPNRQFVVIWDSVRTLSGSYRLVFEVILSEADNSVTYQYRYMDTYSYGSSATVGEQNLQSGNEYLQYSYNTSSLIRGRAIKFWKPSNTTDIGMLRINTPNGLHEMGTINPSVVIKNFGTASQNGFGVKLDIGASYTSTVTVSATVAPGDTYVVNTFSSWTPAAAGIYAVKCSTQLSGDQQTSNDKKTATAAICNLIERFDPTNCGYVADPPTGGFVWRAPAYPRPPAPSPTKCWTDPDSGYYVNSANHNLVSGLYSAILDTPRVVFAQRLYSESYYDGGNFAYSTNGGSSWTILYPDTAGGKCRPYYGTLYSGEQGYSGTIDPWELAWFKIPVSNGATFKLRWKFSSDPSVTYEGGWMIDDVAGIGMEKLAYDVAASAILSPPPVCSLGSYIPSAQIANVGMSDQPGPFYVKYWATGPGTYVDSVLVNGLGAGRDTIVTFANWNINARGAYAVSCSTMSAADSSRSNDKVTATVKAGLVRVLMLHADYLENTAALADSLMRRYPNDFVIDAMCVGSYPSGNPSVPNVDTLVARGYKAIWTWGNYSYLNGPACGDSIARWLELGRGGALVSGWTTSDLGRFTSLYTPCAYPINNGYTSTLGTVYEPLHRIMEGVNSAGVNYYAGSNAALAHSTAYKVADWATGNIIAACNDTADRRIALLGFWPGAIYYGYSSGDLQLMIRNAILWAAQNNDVGVSKLIAPTGDIDSGAVITPACSVYNYGPQAEGPFKVRLRIGAYQDSVTVASLGSREAAYVSFAGWTATIRGSFGVSCSTELTIDSKQNNDKMSGSGYIHVRDVQPTAISAPLGNYTAPAVVVPSGTWKNNGNGVAAFEAWVVLYKPSGARFYASKTDVPGLVPGGSMQIGSFAPCTLRVAGTWTVRCSSYLATGDMVSGNDFFDSTFTVTGGVVEGGWLAKSAMSLAPSGKEMKDGSWLAYNAGNERVYAAKGSKQGDFYSYDPVADAWTQLLSWPAGREAKGPYRGSVGASDGAGKVYATKGNSTLGFWVFDAALNTWTQKVDVPLGPSNKKVKGGTDIAYYDGSVYLLKGYKDEFWRYSPANDSWYQLPNAPTGVSSRWDKGSWLTSDDAGKLYAHKARYHEFYAFDVATNTWGPALIPMPLASYTGKSKKSKDGGAGAYADGAIYAFKGGNTNEFWKYDVAGNAWTEKETIPQVAPSSSKKKKVKGGADIVAVGPVFFATKGNKTLNIWQYTPGSSFSPEPRVGREGIAAGTTVPGTTLLSVSPNPMAGGFVTVSFNLPRTTSATLSVRDLTGRTVASQLVSGRSGTVGLDLRHLSTGVYMVELISGGVTATQKLVVQH